MTLGHGDNRDDMGVERGRTGNACTLCIPAGAREVLNEHTRHMCPIQQAAAQSTRDKISHALMRAQGLIHRRKYKNMAGAVMMAKCNPGHGAVNMSSGNGLRTCWLPMPMWRARALAMGDASEGKDMGRRCWVTGRQHYVWDGNTTCGMAMLCARWRCYMQGGNALCGMAVLGAGRRCWVQNRAE
ncbi:hypothetical protein BKA93DRAFT_844767 [Sparassis latifolia]